MTRRLWGIALATAALGAMVAAPGPGAAADETVTLTVGLLQDIDSPNPTAGYLVSSYEVWNLQYATLTDKAADDFAITPGLAESWEASADGLTYTYHLREGLQWSDGQSLTADDVAWTINTSREQEWVNHFSTTQNLTATAVDDRTVEVVSAVPDPKLPMLDVYILPRHIWEEPSKDDITTYAALDGVGSGPFTLEEWKPGQEWIMKANPSYWQGAPAIDQIVFRLYTEGAAMVAALESGEIDAAHDVPAELFGGLQNRDDITAVVGSQGGMTELGMNAGDGLGDGHPALKDVVVRQAIAHAIDRKALFDRVLLGQGEAIDTLGVSSDPVWNPDIPADQQLNYDPEKAKQMLDDAGYKDTDGDGIREMPGGGQPLKFRYAERSESSQAAPIREFITAWLKEIGIDTEVSVFDDTQLTDEVANGTYDLFVWGWTPFVDPDPMLSYFKCDQVTTDANNPLYNDASWCNPEYDALYAQQNQELDRSKRIDLVHQMVTLFYEQAPYVVLYHDADTQAYRTDRFEGWVQQPKGTGPVLFSNTSPSYFLLKPIGATPETTPATGETTAPGDTTATGDTTAPVATSPAASGSSDDGGSSTGLIIGIIAGVLVIGGGIVFAMRSRSSRDDRE